MGILPGSLTPSDVDGLKAELATQGALIDIVVNGTVDPSSPDGMVPGLQGFDLTAVGEWQGTYAIAQAYIASPTPLLVGVQEYWNAGLALSDNFNGWVDRLRGAKAARANELQKSDPRAELLRNPLDDAAKAVGSIVTGVLTLGAIGVAAYLLLKFTKR
jgi:hypothetical protein